MDVTGKVELEIELKVKRIAKAPRKTDILAFLGIAKREYSAEIEFWQNGKLQNTISVRQGDSIHIV